MAIKTISLEIDAYERLKKAKRGKESFSEVVRRARFDPEPSTGDAILNETAALYAAKKGVARESLDYWDAIQQKPGDASPSHWDKP
jgi:hypothetical protein